ncbi:hypothetical protein [Gordonia crocea]|uniref:J domain-containing protein n=1 Tax=Gordonia crocea TaxID=589162 RepID=A0A7M3SUP5_9ACTN|nr:hypothetical protein [Gordonia crocea]GED96369.1 hypothetical protein nbrc107697_04080 [Gordonia crocea]
MAHIDLYAAFGLDRSASSPNLAARLATTLAATDPSNTALHEQIHTAQAILGDPAKRAAYDARLADPTGPEIDTAVLAQLAGPAPAQSPSGLPVPGWALAAIAVAVVIALGVVGAFVFGGRHSDDTAKPAASSSTEQGASSSTPSGAPPSAAASAPVEDAYPGAGGPRPTGAIPLPTYVSRYGKVLSAHLLTPTGGIGCDFQAADSDGRQGQCGVLSYNKSSSPLGCVNRVGTCKGKWLLPLRHDRVGDPTDSSGTTGWMNQPANDGYRVPRVAYGKQYYFQNWVCASEFHGLTCWNTTTGSGVFLSKQKVERFDGPGKAAPTTSAGGAVVLGSMPPNGKGYGQERPTTVYTGGVGRARVTDITWTSWGGERAEGTGTGVWLREDRVGTEQEVPATIVAWDIGTCNGKRAYRKITWYFPSKGENFDSRSHMKACWS